MQKFSKLVVDAIDAVATNILKHKNIFFESIVVKFYGCKSIQPDSNGKIKSEEKTFKKLSKPEELFDFQQFNFSDDDYAKNFQETFNFIVKFW